MAVTDNALIATFLRIDAATLSTTSPVASTLPLANLQDYRLGKVARFTDNTDISIRIHLTAAAPINLGGLLGTNLSATATWRWLAGDTEADLDATDPPYDSDFASVWPASGKPASWEAPHCLFRPAVPQTYAWWQVDVLDADNASASGVDIGRLALDAAWQPPINIEYGASLGFIDPSIIEAARGGQLLVLERRSRRVGSFTLGFQSEDEMLGNAFETDRLCGKKKPVWHIWKPGADEHLQRYMLYGLQTDLRPIVLPAFDIFEKPFQVEELIA